MNEPLVSVKMITYNHRQYIAKAIEGVLQQKTNFYFELVIGEDCSTDGTREIVLEYQEKYPDSIRVITSDRNIGVKMNSTRARKACRGKYIAWCEGDDYWHHHDKLQLQVGLLEGDREIGLVHSEFDLYYVDTSKRISNYHRYKGKKPESADFLSILNGQSPIRTCTVVARRDLVQRVMDSDSVLFQEERFLMGDTPLWAELSRVARIGYIDESLATYNYLAESLSRSKDVVKQLYFLKSTHEMQLYLLDKYKFPEKMKKSYERKIWSCELWLAFLENRKELGLKAREAMTQVGFRNSLLFWGSQNVYFGQCLKVGIRLYRYFKRLAGITSE